MIYFLIVRRGDWFSVYSHGVNLTMFLFSFELLMLKNLRSEFPVSTEPESVLPGDIG